MLVYFHKGFLMEGTNIVKKKKYPWSKCQEIRQKIYCTTSINGICDESELKTEVERCTKEQLSTGGWGYKFDCWDRVVPYEEACALAQELKWEDDYPIPKNELHIEYIKDWPMEKIIQRLTGTQFAQFCRENNITWR